MKVHILLADYQFDFTDEDILIGVDVNAVHLFNLSSNNKIAIGDFDSCSKDVFFEIEKNMSKTIKVSMNKDESDLELALQEASKYCCPIYVYGFSKGNRADHYLNNLLLFYKYAVKDEIHFVDKKNHLFLLKSGEHIIAADKKYVSLFSFEKSDISLGEGFKYQGNFSITLNTNKFISNEIVAPQAKVKVVGKVIVIQADD